MTRLKTEVDQLRHYASQRLSYEALVACERTFDLADFPMLTGEQRMCPICHTPWFYLADVDVFKCEMCGRTRPKVWLPEPRYV
jgi:hypothetical protein